MNTLNHLTLGQIEHISELLTLCDLTLNTYGEYLGQRKACLGNLIEYICFEAVGHNYKYLMKHFKVMGDQVVCIEYPQVINRLLGDLNPYIETSYAWDFLYHSFGQEVAA